MYKIRAISKNAKNEEVFGVTIPKEYSEEFGNSMCTVQKSGNALIFISGTEFKPDGNKFL